MRTLIVILLFFISFQTVGQSRLSHRSYSGSYNPTSYEPTKYNAQREAGIIRYDLTEVLKKLKLKSTSDKAKKLAAILTTYDTNIENIQLMYNAIFDQMDLVVEEKKTQIKNSGSTEAAQALEVYIDKNLSPVQEQVTPHADKLRDDMQGLLSAKELQKWVKFQEKLARKAS